MNGRLRNGAAALVVLGVLGQGTAGAAPPPAIVVDCAVRVQTKVTWKRTKVERVTIRWVAPAGSTASYPEVVVPVSPRPPRGFVVTATGRSSEGIDPASAVVTLELARGAGTLRVQAPCT